MAGTIWSLIPPLITIILAVKTKQVYLALVFGLLAGSLLFTGFDILGSINVMFTIMSQRVGDNALLLIFLALLGIFVSIINKSGASQAYGEWAAKVIKGKRMAMFVTMLLGIIIFIDDYFNCLTVGTVMRPVTDKFHITRAKLAYVIDATAAPVCIIAPVSSWAAAVASSFPESSHVDGFALFVNTIPFNLYAWLTIIFMLIMIWSGKDYSEMRRYEQNHGGDLFIQSTNPAGADAKPVGDGKIIDLVLPLLVLIGSCIWGMLYTGGILEGASVGEAFSHSDSMRGLVIGSFAALVFTYVFYRLRKTLKLDPLCKCFTEGFKSMVPAMLILVLAWGLAGICSDEYLDLGGFVGNIVKNHTAAIMFLPITVAAILAGAVAGDHVSPISDTTIMASAGAQCNHLDHVRTQLPYAFTVMGCDLVGYIVAGFTQNGWLGLGSSLIVLFAVMFYILKFRAVSD